MRRKLLNTYEFTEDLTISEVLEFSDVIGEPVYEYYANDEFVFGAEDRFTLDMLENLYMQGFFDDFYLT